MGWLIRFLKGGGYYPPAVDIGTYSLKLVQVERSRGSYRPVVHGEFVYEEQVFAGTEVIDRYLLATYIKQLLEENKVKDKKIVIHVPLSACFYSVISIPATKNPEESVMNYMQSIISPEEFSQVEIDYKVLPVSIQEGTLDIAIAAVKKEFLEDRKSILEQVGLAPVVVDIEPAALANQFYLNHPESTSVPVCLVDIGASFTKIVICFGGYPYVTRNIELGGNFITEQIQKEFMLSIEDAELLKRGEDIKDVTHQEAFDKVIAKVIKKLVTETMWTMENFKDRFNLEVSTVYLFGGTAKTRDIVETFKSYSGMDVMLGFPLGFAGITGEPEYGVAVGLSLRYKGDSHAKI